MKLKCCDSQLFKFAFKFEGGIKHDGTGIKGFENFSYTVIALFISLIITSSLLLFVNVVYQVEETLC